MSELIKSVRVRAKDGTPGDFKASLYSENGNISLLVPEMQELSDDDIVDDHIVLMAAIAVKLNIDNSFKAELIDWYENYLNNMESKWVPK